MGAVEAVGAAVVKLAGIVLIAMAAAAFAAPGRCRRSAIAIAPELRRVGSAAQRRSLNVAGALAAALGVALVMLSPSPLVVAGSALMILGVAGAIGALRRVSPVHGRLPQRALRTTFRQLSGSLRNRASRRAALRTVHAVAQREIDASVLAIADLAWWAATVAPGSMRIDGIDVAAHTVAVPGRHGELTAVAPPSGALTLLLVTSVGTVGGVSVRVAI